MARKTGILRDEKYSVLSYKSLFLLERKISRYVDREIQNKKFLFSKSFLECCLLMK